MKLLEKKHNPSDIEGKVSGISTGLKKNIFQVRNLKTIIRL